MAKKRVVIANDEQLNDEQLNGEDIRSVLAAQGTLRMVQKQADRLCKLFQLPAGYPDKGVAIARYQDALFCNGIEVPPTTIHEAIELINEVGEFHG